MLPSLMSPNWSLAATSLDWKEAFCCAMAADMPSRAVFTVKASSTIASELNRVERVAGLLGDTTSCSVTGVVPG